MNNANLDPKLLAKSLRASLSADGIEKSHSQCLEIVARQLGHADWNTLAASRVPKEVKPLPNLVLPNGWQIAGTQAQDYRIGVEADGLAGPARIVSTKENQSEAAFATLMQSIDAKNYLGKLVMCKAEIRCFDTQGYVTIWMRVDDEDKKTLAFDNMEMRKVDGTISATKDWSKRRIVLEVPKNAASIHFGFFLKGNGHGEARKFVLTEAPEKSAVTSFGSNRLPEAMNLDFIERALRV